jgi:hypothetical protein
MGYTVDLELTREKIGQNVFLTIKGYDVTLYLIRWTVFMAWGVTLLFTHFASRCIFAESPDMISGPALCARHFALGFWLAVMKYLTPYPGTVIYSG